MTKTRTNILLGKDDPPPYEIFNPEGKAKCLILCDHAGNAVPKALDNLGLAEEYLHKHCAIDIGARGVSVALAELLDAPCVLANYSRLVVDLNRYLDHPTAFVKDCEGYSVPGNVNMSEEDRRARITGIYEVYHRAVEEQLARFEARGVVPAIISVHSFTKYFYRQERPWEIGVLWAHDGRLPLPVIGNLRREGFTVGDNEPYDARMLWGTTVNIHGDAHGFPNILFEVRNDLIADPAGEKEYAEILAASMKDVLEDERLYSLYEGEKVVHDPVLSQTYFDELVRKAKKGE